MITCNRCGYTMNPDGVGSCQRCGTPVSSKVEGGFGPRMGAQEQPELPAWLESLRVGERAGAPASNPANPAPFSTADLIDEGTLPSWMRAGSAGASNNPPSDPANNTLRPAAFPAPTTDAGAFPGRGLSAQSLIDEQSLPSWMQEGKARAASTPPNGVEASSLVQADAVPDWMKTVQPSNTSRAVPQPAMPPAPVAPSMNSTPSINPAMSSSGGASSSQPPHGFSPRELIDEKSLPSWMTQQNGNNGPAAAPMPQPATPGQPGGFSPSSLVDMDALPPWLRENGQQPGMVPPAQPQQPGQPPRQASPSFSAPQQGGNAGLAASSFVDPNALPEWLRASAGQSAPGAQMPPQQGPIGNQRPAPYAASPRVEQVRVPNRPRSEVASNESSEVAANVFASMLGVASAAPHFAGPPANPAASYGQSYPMQPNIPPGAPMPGPVSGPAYGMPEPAPGSAVYGVPGQPPQAYPNSPSAAYPPMSAPGAYNSGYPGGQGNYAAGGPQAGASPVGAPPPYAQYPAGGPPPQGAPAMTRDERQTKKRGRVAGLIDWLFSR